jgi:hypothetical protein
MNRTPGIGEGRHSNIQEEKTFLKGISGEKGESKGELSSEFFTFECEEETFKGKINRIKSLVLIFTHIIVILNFYQIQSFTNLTNLPIIYFIFDKNLFKSLISQISNC